MSLMFQKLKTRSYFELCKTNFQLLVLKYYKISVSHVDPLHNWFLNLNNNSLQVFSLILVLPDKGFFTT